VVRLKGGDPFVFGRGGEEADALSRAGIPFEVVPGVSSAVAVPAYAGIPLTHRGVASSFAVVTGHEEAGKCESSVDWARLARSVDTLVILMGLKSLPRIARELIAHGRPATTPAALVRWGTTEVQETVVGTLADIAARAARARLEPPVVAVVGDVVALRARLQWFADNHVLMEIAQ
jgi:uroporphyrinogen III methyltransferase/synthase